ncbi:recombinase RecT [Allorhizobium sp. BGMRC 0089]|uniref:RecT family recombinase n=1 Tax=Allorhizobium sonneratiae TaxID=2934936 RepID=UPI002033FFA5|nr:RecT family recombinase [Allorhizobium sonneratiae]MCM2294779.1 recombinase RecT [Allorhizobium sonneratiae]
MNAITKIDNARPSLIATMASKFNMDPKAFEATVRATVMPSQHTNEQFAALMMVAKEYDLNPLTKEIYAFPAKGGGIVPVVSIDGWVNLVNSHPACDGFEFEFEHTEDGTLISCTCRMYRKDRGRPVTVTEYLLECIRSTDPWKMKHRMLRHKAMIQAARYAFGFSGIYDEDEGSKIAESIRDITPPSETKASVLTPPKPPAPPSAKTINAEPAQDEQPAESEFDLGAYLEDIETSLAGAKDEVSVEEIWNDFDAPATLESEGHADMIEAAFSIKTRRLAQLSPLNGG